MDEQADFVEGTRSRNILTLEERVRAIKEFDRVPVYQKVADIMNCSAKQIRNIVVNRESILLYYASKTGECPTGLSKHNDRFNKIEFLNCVMYEWIQRTRSREGIGRISPKLIRTIALDVKNHLTIPSFSPSKAWLEDFMMAYNLNEETLSQKDYSSSGEIKPHLSLKISDIVDDVKRNRKTYNFYKRNGTDVEEYDEMKSENDSCSYLYENSNSGTADEYDEVKVVIEDDDDEEDDGYLETPAKKRKVDDTKNSNGDGGGGAVYIESYEEALQHLKPLEDFVLLEENFRAIGVISQLEAIFRNPE